MEKVLSHYLNGASGGHYQNFFIIERLSECLSRGLCQIVKCNFGFRDENSFYVICSVFFVKHLTFSHETNMRTKNLYLSVAKVYDDTLKNIAF